MKFVLPDETVELFSTLSRDTVSQALPLLFYSFINERDEDISNLSDAARLAYDMGMRAIAKRTKRNARQARYQASVGASEMTQEKNKGKEGEESFPPHPLYKEEGESQTSKRTPQSPSLSFADESKLFAMFWHSYPKKVGKAVAELSFHKIIIEQKDPVSFVNRLCAIVEKKAKCFDWTKNNRQYCPHPSTYLNQARWEDEELEPETTTDDKVNDLASELAKGLI